MRVLVTGGCGFIGANFIYYMLEKYPDMEIVNLDKLTYAGNLANLRPLEQGPDSKRYFFVRADIADPEAVSQTFEKFHIDAVVNFAAETHVDRSINDPAPFVTTNVLGTQNLLWTARQKNVPRFVHISTDEVYGSLGAKGKFTESSPLAPNSPYSASKAAADMLIRAYCETYGFPAIVTRCSNNYGPYQFPEKLIPLMFKKALEDKPLPIYGDGQNVRDWIYVADHCLGVDLALRKGKPGAIYNFGGDAEKTNLELVKILLEKLGKPESLISFVKDRPGHDRRYAMDFGLAEKELGFKPEHTFEQGLEKTLSWYRENREWMEGVLSGAYLEFMKQWYEER